MDNVEFSLFLIFSLFVQYLIFNKVLFSYIRFTFYIYPLLAAYFFFSSGESFDEIKINSYLYFFFFLAFLHNSWSYKNRNN